MVRKTDPSGFQRLLSKWKNQRNPTKGRPLRYLKLPKIFKYRTFQAQKNDISGFVCLKVF